jgi:hypothetical protein
MAIKHLTYLDIDPAKRSEAAEEARKRLRAHLSSPFTTADTASQIQAQIAKIDAWEHGQVPAAPAPKAGRSHVVGVSENMKISES